MQEDVYAAVKEPALQHTEDAALLSSRGHHNPCYLSQSAHTEAAKKKDTVGLHVTMNDVLGVQIAENGEREMTRRFLLVRCGVTDSVSQTYSMP